MTKIIFSRDFKESRQNILKQHMLILLNTDGIDAITNKLLKCKYINNQYVNYSSNLK